MEGTFVVVGAYALVGFIWFMRGLNGYENKWEYKEGETKVLSRFHKVVDGVEYFWKPKRVGGAVSIQEGEWVTYDKIDAGYKASPNFYETVKDRVMGYKWVATHDKHGTSYEKQPTSKSLADLSYKEALALTQEEFEEASKVK